MLLISCSSHLIDRLRREVFILLALGVKMLELVQELLITEKRQQLCCI